MAYRFTIEAINLLIFNKGQIKIGGDFPAEGETSANFALLQYM